MIGAPHGTARPRRAAFGAPAASGLVPVPISIGLATLVLPVGTLSYCSRRLTVAQKFGTGC